MTVSQQYAIRGGIEGRERLRLLSRVMNPCTTSLFDRLSICGELNCLDVGCGGGDFTRELAKRVTPQGRVVGIDIDPAKLELARKESAEQEIANVEFLEFDILTETLFSKFDVVYARFLLTHLIHPSEVVATFFDQLRPGGLVIVEDIDFSGYFAYPELKAFRRYHELYCTVVKNRGGDPNIGLRLPSLLADGGFENIGLNVVQPVGTQGEAKLINPITMENIAESVIQDELASQPEIDALVEELCEFARNPQTVAGLPRVFQTWGYRPAI